MIERKLFSLAALASAILMGSQLFATTCGNTAQFCCSVGIPSTVCLTFTDVSVVPHAGESNQGSFTLEELDSQTPVWIGSTCLSIHASTPNGFTVSLSGDHTQGNTFLLAEQPPTFQTQSFLPLIVGYGAPDTQCTQVTSPPSSYSAVSPNGTILSVSSETNYGTETFVPVYLWAISPQTVPAGNYVGCFTATLTAL